MFGLSEELKEYSYLEEEQEKFQYAKITTSKGVIWIKLFNQETPIAVANFATLANDMFYDGLTFHRVIPRFMAQSGCPDGTGMSGPGWAIECETKADKQIHNRGSLSMAHSGKNTSGSQFFITFVPCPHLDGGHTVFGEIQKEDNDSFDTLDKIEQNDIIESIEIMQVRD